MRNFGISIAAIFIFPPKIGLSWDGTVSVVMGFVLDHWCSNPNRDKRIFTSSKMSRQLLGPM